MTRSRLEMGANTVFDRAGYKLGSEPRRADRKATAGPLLRVTHRHGALCDHD